jgi:capsular exopolysaccharide synthesis family protein
MQTSQQESIHQNYIIELFKIVLPYKWSIIFITLLAILLAKFYLYFIPLTYQSYAVIKVKVDNQPKTEDFLRDILKHTNSDSITQEMLSLKTFKLNNKALSEVNFSTQYFKKENYKFIELYKDLPLEVTLIHDINLTILGQKILLQFKRDGFTLSTEKHGETKVYTFDEEVKTPYFTGLIKKKSFLHEPIYIKLNGTNRQVYQNIILRKLSTQQINLKANLIKVSFEDTIPARANAYLDSLINLYITESIYRKDNTNNKILTFLNLQLVNIQEKLEKAEDALESYKSLNSVEPTIKSNDSFTKLSTVDLSLSELTLKEKLAQNLIVFVRNNRNLDAIGPTLLEFNDQATIKFIDALEILQQKEDELSIEFTNQYPQLINIRKRIKRIKNKILLNVANLKSTLIIKRSALEKQKQKYEQILRDLPKEEKKLIHFQRDYDVNTKMYSYLLEQKSENELIQVASISDYEIIDKAYTPGAPIKPKKLIVLITAMLIGFVFAIFISLLRVLLLDKVSTEQDIKLLTKLSIYGVIPLYESTMFSTVKLKEAYHRLATNLQFSKQENSGSIILLSSHSEGEGKTTTVVNLAGVFKNTQYKTIVIDLNMRAPSLHEHFGIEQQYSGISTYLSQRDNIGNIIFATSFSNLDIIPAGPIPPNPSELILSPRLHELFQTLKENYDYILLDTSAYTSAIETLYLMKFTTMNLIILREKFSKKSTVTNLETIIQEKNLTNIGLVLKSIVKEDKNSLLINSSTTNNSSPSTLISN